MSIVCSTLRAIQDFAIIPVRIPARVKKIVFLFWISDHSALVTTSESYYQCSLVAQFFSTLLHFRVHTHKKSQRTVGTLSGIHSLFCCAIRLVRGHRWSSERTHQLSLVPVAISNYPRFHCGHTRRREVAEMRMQSRYGVPHEAQRIFARTKRLDSLFSDT